MKIAGAFLVSNRCQNGVKAMPIEVMKYKGFRAIFTYDSAASLYKGEVIGITGVVRFFCATQDELLQEFKKSIDDQLIDGRLVR